MANEAPTQVSDFFLPSEARSMREEGSLLT